MNDFKDAMRYVSYIECQMHGDVTVDDVESIVLPPSSYDWTGERRNQLKEILKVTDEKGIKVYENFRGKVYRLYLDGSMVQYEEYKGE